MVNERLSGMCRYTIRVNLRNLSKIVLNLGRKLLVPCKNIFEAGLVISQKFREEEEDVPKERRVALFEIALEFNYDGHNGLHCCLS